jgi:hypothetical protein
LYLPGIDRIANLVKRVEELEEEEVDRGLEKVMKDFANRHRDIEQTFSNHFMRIEDQFGSSLSHFSSQRKLLLGAFLLRNIPFRRRHYSTLPLFPS